MNAAEVDRTTCRVLGEDGWWYDVILELPPTTRDYMSAHDDKLNIQLSFEKGSAA